MTVLFLAEKWNYWRYGRLDPKEGWLEPLEVPLGEHDRLPAEAAGWWGRLGNRRAAYFVWTGELFLRIEARQWRLAEPSLEIRLDRGWLRHTLVVRDADGTLRLTYPRPFGRGFREAFWSWLTVDWPVDERDVDFGLWLEELAQTERREQLLERRPFSL